MNIVTFSIGDTPITLNTVNPIRVTEAFRPFVTENREKGIRVSMHMADRIDFPVAQPVFSNDVFSVYEDEQGFYRVFYDRGENRRKYAVGRVLSDNREEITYLKDSSQLFTDSQNCFSHIGLEELLLRKDEMILHASLIASEYGGILFSGPSGAGKSTQADLWVRYRGAKLINGDRTILKKTGGIWRAYGSPYAGSSRCFVNESVKVRAIVLPQKSERFEIHRIDPVQAFCKIYAGMIVNIWNSDYVDRISAMVQQLIQEVPVYLFHCGADRKTADMLGDFIEREQRYADRKD